MGANSNIEWTDHTFNPWLGCTKVSPGCANCYADEIDRRRYSKTLDGGTKDAPVRHFGPGAPRHRTSAANWRQPILWDAAAGRRRHAWDEFVGWHGRDVALKEGLIEPTRPRVFCASLADWLDDEVPIEWLADLLDLIRRTPHLDWLLLTKRPQNWRARMGAVVGMKVAPDSRAIDQCSAIALAAAWLNGAAPANVWIGTTVEDQVRADERRADLEAIPARVHFVSHEPSLSVVDWTGWEFGDWFISGGESGPKARPSHPDAHRALREFCAKNQRAYFFKQWGEWLPDCQRDFRINIAEKHTRGLVQKSGGSRTVFQNGKRVDDPTHRDGESGTLRVGIKAAGRLLDGCEHSAFPEVLP